MTGLRRNLPFAIAVGIGSAGYHDRVSDLQLRRLSDPLFARALNTAFRNPTMPATSSVKILGVTVCQPSGLNFFMRLPLIDLSGNARRHVGLRVMDPVQHMWPCIGHGSFFQRVIYDSFGSNLPVPE